MHTRTLELKYNVKKWKNSDLVITDIFACKIYNNMDIYMPINLLQLK